MADTNTVTYEDIKKAVFYTHEKPEMLADIIAKAIGVEKNPTSGTTPPAPTA